MSNTGPLLPPSSSRSGPTVIGLIGGVASGKSFVAQLLEELGAIRLDADGAGHEVLRTPEVEDLARRRWGESIFGPDGRIVRKALAAIVFEPSEEGRQELTYLEQITHPRIGDRLRAQAAALAARSGSTGVQPVMALILDAPVLLEAGWDDLCDYLVYVDAPETRRLTWALARGWTEEEFRRRERAQVPLAEKRSRADFVIDNSGSAENTKSEVNRFWKSVFG
jgi:dephospho-CoA kinase